MELAEHIEKEVFEMLNALRRAEALRLKNQSGFSYCIFPDEVVIVDRATSQQARVISEERRKVLFKLVDLGILEARHDKEAVEEDELTFFVKLNHKKFDELYENLMLKLVKGQKKNEARTHLFVDNNGNFWADPKDQLCYSMGEDSERLKILLYLVDNNGFQNTDVIANHLGEKGKQGVRTEIGKMKAKIKQYLRLDNVIESKRGSGYRINPAYRVIRYQKP